jgi:hypothetical protein
VDGNALEVPYRRAVPADVPRSFSCCQPAARTVRTASPLQQGTSVWQRDLQITGGSATINATLSRTALRASR